MLLSHLNHLGAGPQASPNSATHSGCKLCLVKRLDYLLFSSCTFVFAGVVEHHCPLTLKSRAKLAGMSQFHIFLCLWSCQIVKPLFNADCTSQKNWVKHLLTLVNIFQTPSGCTKVFEDPEAIDSLDSPSSRGDLSNTLDHHH